MKLESKVITYENETTLRITYSEGGCIVGKYLHEKGYGETY